MGMVHIKSLEKGIFERTLQFRMKCAVDFLKVVGNNYGANLSLVFDQIKVCPPYNFF